jgi:hypothetical protein
MKTTMATRFEIDLASNARKPPPHNDADAPLDDRSRRTYGSIGLAAAVGLARVCCSCSPNLLDGDECTSPMARHCARTRVSVFADRRRPQSSRPRGRAEFCDLAGAVPLKLAMLAVWIVGICFYFLAFSRPLGTARSFWITLLLVVMPAWAVASMKAWSGYVTAFSATALVLHLITRNDHLRSSSLLIAGGVSAIIFFSQPLACFQACCRSSSFFLVSSRRLSFWLCYLLDAGRDVRQSR